MRRARFGHHRPLAAYLVLGASIALSAVAGSCGGHADGAGGGARAPGGGGAVPVSVATAQRADVPIEIHAVGSVDSPASVVIRPLVTGAIHEVRFAEGADVRAGDLLVQIDPRPFQAALHVAEANLARDQALARDAMEAAQQTEEALGKKAVSERSASQTRAAAAAATALVQRDEAEVERARLELEYCAVRAPFDARTGKLQIQVGSVVKANDATIVTLNQIAPIRVSFAVPEKYLADIRAAAKDAHLPVRVRRQGSDVPVEGVLTFVDNSVDRSTGTIALMASYPNEDRSLWPGQFVDVTLELGVERDAIVVPTRAVQSGQKGDLAYVVKPDQTADVRNVVVSRNLGALSVISDGIAEGESVVTDGQLRLVPGTRVTVQAPADKPAPAPAPAKGSAPADGSAPAQGGTR